MQQFLALLGALGTVLALISQLLAGSPSSGAGGFPVPPPSSQVIVVTDGLGDVHVNGITVGQPVDQIRVLHEGFPEDGTVVFLETGDTRVRYDFEGAEYYVAEGVVTRIGMPHTPEGIRGGSGLAEATARYGRPVHGYSSSNGGRYAVYVAEEQLNLAWIFEYSGRSVRKVYLDHSLDRMRRDAAAVVRPMLGHRSTGSSS
ncbi:hypothetical protein [Corynebacterium pygosceleis]|uniref:Uncharacterized protein n=1 Tax=Corynebacterium pygosceleis TaxID=2800406 RepID=A0A9Q4C6R8_9CORY|nr:hypothetical protein [Corynebacterium pygosceleis]MCK7637672.1 hypothetical protein [Corynebacterium pygosceleis]MCK7674863.1 hypothetical protein [Corynebacterium pygosceleis]MCL0119548.1 hypothetical protein [Corynebacterium pygosceleis]MCX7467999.1 hypothetical protein [Corynebacterium pygosceleis]